MPTTRSPSPSRYSVSVVSSVRQMMREGYFDTGHGAREKGKREKGKGKPFALDSIFFTLPPRPIFNRDVAHDRDWTARSSGFAAGCGCRVQDFTKQADLIDARWNRNGDRFAS